MRKLMAICLFIIMIFLSNFNFVSASGAQDKAQAGLSTTNLSAGLSSSNLVGIIGNVIGALLSVLGVVFLIIVVRGGVMWMLAGGDGEDVGKAKKMIQNGVIGLIICIVSYTISDFVVSNAVNITTK